MDGFNRKRNPLRKNTHYMLFCFVVVLLLCNICLAEGPDIDVYRELDKLKSQLADNKNPEEIKTQLLQLLDIAAEQELDNTEIHLAIDEAHMKIMEKRPQEERERFSMFYFLKQYSKSLDPVFSFAKLDSKNQCIDNSRLLRKKLIDLLGGFPEKPPLNPVLLEKETFDDYIREKIMFDAEPGRSVVGYVLLPKDQKTPLPAVICLHEHGGEYFKGKDGPVGEVKCNSDLTYALDLTKRGYITLTIDAACFGERVEDEGRVNYIGTLVGRPLFGFIVYDDIRSVDYILTRKEVDKKRIGCIGHSMGGVRAIFLSALDKRIKAGVSLSGFSNIRDQIEKDEFEWPPTTYLQGFLKFAEMEDIVSLIAPRAFLLAVGEFDDTLGLENFVPDMENIRRVYSYYHRKDHFAYIMFKDEGHSFPPLYHNEVYAWIEKWL